MVAIGLVAGASVLYQIVLTRVFSFLLWHHFAFMIISIAVLGLAVSGVVLRFQAGGGADTCRRAAFGSLAFALTAAAAVAVVARLPIDPTRIAEDPVHIARLALAGMLLLVPFTCAGLVVIALLESVPARADRLYGSDLVGAGLGCIAAIVALQHVGADGALFFVSGAAAGAAGLLATASDRPASHLAAAGAALAVGFPLAALTGASVLPVLPGPSKAMRTILDPRRYPEARIAETAWNAVSRVDVIENSASVRWVANLRTAAPVPRQTLIVIDGDAATPIVAGSRHIEDLRFLDHMVSAAPLAAFRPQRALVIGAGGGVDVLAALYHGAARVDAVEVNPAIARIMTGSRAEEAGRLFERPGVRLYLDEGRSFVRHNRDRYDAIQLSLVDTFAASASGAYSLMEGYLYTVEAFDDYLRRLQPDGFITVTRWLGAPPREALKVCTVAVEALRRFGSERPEAHVLVLGQDNIGSVVVKRSPFTPDEVARLRTIASERGIDVLHAPGSPAEAGIFGRALAGAGSASFLSAYPFDISPATDDSPFFFQFGRWRDVVEVGRGWGESGMLISGRLLLLLVLAEAVVGALAFVVLPMLARHTELRGAEIGGSRVLGFFFLIGVSFMLLEVTLMQRFTLLLGQPIYALALVLAVLLVSAGAGSFSARYTRKGLVSPRNVLLAVVAMVLVEDVLLRAVFVHAIGWGLASRLAVSAALIWPLGFLLGMPLPSALAGLRPGSPLVGWAWALNGCGSVLGPIVASLVAIDLGFSAVMLLAAAGYAAAWLLFPVPRAEDAAR
jgi:hypothetical protein